MDGSGKRRSHPAVTSSCWTARTFAAASHIYFLITVQNRFIVALHRLLELCHVPAVGPAAHVDCVGCTADPKCLSQMRGALASQMASRWAPFHFATAHWNHL